MPPRKRIGDILKEEGFITEEQLQIALAEQKKTGELLGSILFGLGFISQKSLFKVLSVTQQNISDAPDREENEPELPEEIDYLIQQSNTLFQRSGEPHKGEFDSPHSPLVNLVEKILINGIRRGATDVHINPDLKGVRIRYRIDGILHHGMFVPSKLLNPIVSRVKVMGQMNIAETRIPQDGSAEFFYKNRGLDLRISSFPVLGGENIVIRILDKSQVLVGIESLGFLDEDIDLINDALSLPHGMILVTGPTGSGKTTTLYSFLSMINSVNRNMFTIEDPIEYHLPLARQAQVNVKAGLTFATGLRSILRQDPDVILIGEMRDAETAELAVRASLTGHLVFSTLHTNDAASSIIRLTDIGIDPFLVSSTINTIVAQRLARVLCPQCKEPLPADDPAYVAAGADPKSQTLYRPTGCRACNNAGFKGRTVIYEILKIDRKIRDLINARASIDDILGAAVKNGFRGMAEVGLKKVLQGVTTLEEIRSIARSAS
ncbi:MAG: Flp pilus assembly complex ATPase component TadA [Desulfuromonadales bacterium]|nr:Flp pilus assembly complex ATPase component TadA [Desulfuromonadales bacterium]